MIIREAVMEDFDVVFNFVEKLWAYNTYDKNVIERVYREVLDGENDFAYLMFEGNKPLGFCHGTFFNTFWTSGMVCYVSSIIVDAELRKRGYGRALMDKAKELAGQRNCTAIVLDSGNPRKEAHKFYEIYGFDQSALCFYYKL